MLRRIRIKAAIASIIFMAATIGLLPLAASAIEDIKFTPQVSIPGSSFTKGTDVTLSQSTKSIGEYIKAIYNYGVGIVGILAAIIIMVGGVVWITAAGNEKKIDEAKEWIGGAFTGLILVLLSYMLFKTINPELVNLKASKIQIIRGETYMKCCGGAKGVQAIPVQIGDDGKKYKMGSLDKNGKPEEAKCSEGAECANGEECIGQSSGDSASATNKYSCVKIEKCGENKKGLCACIEPDGYETDSSGDGECITACSDGSTPHCYKLVNVKGGKCGSGGLGRCMYEGGTFDSNDCDQKWGGESCGTHLWCCKVIIKVAPKVDSKQCASNEGKSCDFNGGFGYCKAGVCQPCKKYGEGCIDHAQCPDQQYNAQTNTNQQCGTNANDNNGDCSLVLGNVCDANDD